MLENGTPLIVWLCGYSLFVCAFSHYLLKRVWHTRPKFLTLMIISFTTVEVILLLVVTTGTFVYVCGGYVHGVRFSLSQSGHTVDITKRLAVSTGFAFVSAMFDLICVVIMMLLYQRLNFEWAKAIVWLKREPSERSSLDFPAVQKYMKYNDGRKDILEGNFDLLKESN